MSIPIKSDNDNPVTRILVTGANSGLGFAICCRLIDEFLYTRNKTQTLHLIFTTRDEKKRDATLRRLKTHALTTIRDAPDGFKQSKGMSLARLNLDGLLVDLLKLKTVKALAIELFNRREPLDAVIWNAGITGWRGFNWPKAVWDILSDLVHNTTYPDFALANLGQTAKPQFHGAIEEPPLAQVFTANVLGHYMLTHWLFPILPPTSRIIWISSISAVPETFSADDIQGFSARLAYEGSKRLTDYLVLTSELPSTAPYVSSFLPPPPRLAPTAIATTIVANEPASEPSPSAATTLPRPRMYAAHPGVVATNISDIHPILTFFMTCFFYLARFLGSPWHPVQPYLGAVSAVFLALAPRALLDDDWESGVGKGKWGSATNVLGSERVARTVVEGWGLCGQVGVVPKGSINANIFKRKTETDAKAREEFEVVGGKVWREMEEIRVLWEGKLKEAEKVEGK